MESSAKAPSLVKLGACLIYEALTIIALCFVSALMFILIAGDATHGVKHDLFRLFLWLFVGMYYIWCWLKTGQTLAMQAWHLKLVSHAGCSLSLAIAISRYMMATLSLILFGFGFLWAIIDRDRLFLHDRLLKKFGYSYSVIDLKVSQNQSP
jgi:uncharacterized RDD family membrane protein YckC